MQTERTRELAVRARGLSDQGEKLATIAAALGISLPYASDLLRDPTGEQRRQRRREPPPAPPRASELGAGDMAWVASVWLGFTVSRAAVEKAARRGAVTCRKGPRGARLFDPERVLSEIDAGIWRPHRSRDDSGEPLRGQGWITETCANPRCTRGWLGRRAERTIRRSHHLRLADEWTCSSSCEAAVGGKQRRPERRECGCDGCSNVIRVTRHQARTESGPKRCDDCKAAGRKTAAQQKAARAALDRNRNSEAARAHQAALGKKNGQRNRRSPDRMDKMIEGRMRAHGKPYTEEMRKSVRGRALARGQRDSPRSLDTRRREARLRELWPTGLTVERIADELGVTVSSVKEMRRRLSLPPRPRGRRPAE